MCDLLQHYDAQYSCKGTLFWQSSVESLLIESHSVSVQTQQQNISEGIQFHLFAFGIHFQFQCSLLSSLYISNFKVAIFQIHTAKVPLRYIAMQTFP